MSSFFPNSLQFVRGQFFIFVKSLRILKVDKLQFIFFHTFARMDTFFDCDIWTVDGFYPQAVSLDQIYITLSNYLNNTFSPHSWYYSDRLSASEGISSPSCSDQKQNLNFFPHLSLNSSPALLQTLWLCLLDFCLAYLFFISFGF